MKKMLWGFSVCALILSSCSQNEVLDTPSADKLITFSNLNNRVTRAANDASANYSVYALKAGTVYADGLFSFDNIEVVGTTNSYNGGTLLKWPTSTTLDFFSFAPYTTTGTLVRPAAIATSGAINYTVAAVANEDFTIADKVSASSGVVGLKFNHMLSKIQLGKVDLAADLRAQFTLSSVDGNGIQMRFVSKSNKGDNDIKALTDWTNVNNDVTTHAISGAPNKPAYDYAAAKSHLIMPRQGTLKATGMYLQLRNVKITDNAAPTVNLVKDVAAETVYTQEGDILMYRIPEGSTIDNEFKRGRRYTVNFTLGSDLRLPTPTDPENPDVPGEEVFKDYIRFSATEVNWIDEDMDINLSSVMLGEPAVTYLNALANTVSSVFPTTSVNVSSLWDWTTVHFNALSTGDKCYLDFSSVTFNASKVEIKLTDNIAKMTAASGMTSASVAGVTTYTITAPTKVTITKTELCEPSATVLNSLAVGATSIFATSSLNNDLTWNWTAATFNSLSSAGQMCYIDFANVVFNGHKVSIQLTDTKFLLTGTGVTSSTAAGVTTYVVSTTTKVAITKK